MHEAYARGMHVPFCLKQLLQNTSVLLPESVAFHAVDYNEGKEALQPVVTVVVHPDSRTSI